MKSHLLRYFLFILPLLAGGQAALAQAGDNAPLPAFSFPDTEGNVVTPDDLPANKPIIVFYFDPFCDHCQQEAQWIKENIDQFKNISLVWVSWAEAKDIREFPGKYLEGIDLSNFFFLRDADFTFDSFFGYSEIPSIYVYNRYRKRTASFKKETEPVTLLKYAK